IAAFFFLGQRAAAKERTKAAMLAALQMESSRQTSLTEPFQLCAAHAARADGPARVAVAVTIAAAGDRQAERRGQAVQLAAACGAVAGVLGLDRSQAPAVQLGEGLLSAI